MHIFKSMCVLKEISNLSFTNLAVCIISFEYWFCTVASRSLSRESIRIILFKMPHLCCGAIIFFDLRKLLQRKIFKEVACALGAQCL